MTTATIIAICTSVYGLASEIIGASKLKSNTTIGFIMDFFGTFFGKK